MHSSSEPKKASTDRLDLESLENHQNAPMFGIIHGQTRQLIVCGLGVFVCYAVYGVVQEKITKAKYNGSDATFTFTLSLVFSQCIFNALFARTSLRLQNNDGSADKTSLPLYVLCSMSYIGAMFSSNYALRWVAYPTQVLGKAVKPIPVMLLGVLLARKRYSFLKYCFVLLITAGVALFLYKDKKKSTVDSDHTFGVGELFLVGLFMASAAVCALTFVPAINHKAPHVHSIVHALYTAQFVSLLLDGITGAIQDRMRSQQPIDPFRMMLQINVWSSLWLSIALLLTGEAFRFIPFAIANPGVVPNLFLFGLTSALGQVFIFITISKFGPLTCSIITTTRKLFTILFSVLAFGHAMSTRQWLATGMVFTGLFLDNKYGKDKTPPKSEKLSHPEESGDGFRK